MPTFHVYIPAQKFSGDEKRALADALNLALHARRWMAVSSSSASITTMKASSIRRFPTRRDPIGA
jgi:hypothetical protein